MLLESTLETSISKSVRFVGKESRRSAFLTYDIPTLLNWYSGESRIWNALPYMELANFLNDPWPGAGNPGITRRENQFFLAPGPPDELAGFQHCAFDAFTRENRVGKFDSEVVRIEKYSGSGHMFEVRPCRYSDGLRSNYAMDWNGELKPGGQPFSIRSLMAREYGPRLPPLDEPRLSNAIGLAAIVWYRTEDGDLLPYLPKRAKANLAVFPGGFHCTASGEAEWKPGAASFDQMFTADVCRELYEEVGLRREDLQWIVPVALCREFLRGGKPQLFFAALSKVEEHELAPRRREAIRRQILAGRQEILDDFLTVESPEQLYLDLGKYGSIESLANMCYAQLCIEFASRAGALNL
jgi:8-oxo-dGTP pyrophosphatase MutT (NUDIX family)